MSQYTRISLLGYLIAMAIVASAVLVFASPASAAVPGCDPTLPATATSSCSYFPTMNYSPLTIDGTLQPGTMCVLNCRERFGSLCDINPACNDAQIGFSCNPPSNLHSSLSGICSSSSDPTTDCLCLNPSFNDQNLPASAVNPNGCDPTLPPTASRGCNFSGGTPPATPPPTCDPALPATNPSSCSYFPTREWTPGNPDTRFCVIPCTASDPTGTQCSSSLPQCAETKPGFSCGTAPAGFGAVRSCSASVTTGCVCWTPTYSDPSAPKDAYNVGGYDASPAGSPTTTPTTPTSSPPPATTPISDLVTPGTLKPAVLGQGGFAGFVAQILEFIDYLVFFLIVVAFLVFVWGMIHAWVIGSGNEQSVEKGKQLAIAGVIGFVIIFSLWGIIAIVQATFFNY